MLGLITARVNQVAFGLFCFIICDKLGHPLQKVCNILKVESRGKLRSELENITQIRDVSYVAQYSPPCAYQMGGST